MAAFLEENELFVPEDDEDDVDWGGDDGDLGGDVCSFQDHFNSFNLFIKFTIVQILFTLLKIGLSYTSPEYLISGGSISGVRHCTVLYIISWATSKINIKLNN